MKKIFTLLILNCIISYSIANDYDFEYNGLYYTITSVSEQSVFLSGPPDNVEYPDNLVIPSTVEYNGKTLFVKGIYRSLSTCKNIKSITIPGTVTIIYDNAFDECISLTKVTFEDGTDDLKLGHGTKYTIDNHICYHGLFYHCPLVSVYIGRNFIFEDYYYRGYNDTNFAPFNSITSLKELYFGEKCKSIGARSFAFCSGLESVHFSSQIETIEHGAFYGCKSLKTLQLPESLTLIGTSAFQGLEKLKEITIPQKVSKIGQSSFSYCPNLKKIVFLGKTNLESNVFCYENEPTADVYVYSKEPSQIKNDSFSHNTFLQNLYVPKGTKELYASSTGWKEFWNIIELSSEPQKKCESPIIAYENGILKIESMTPLSKCYYSLDCSDITPFKQVTSEITLNANYEIKAYATAEGYSQSEIATAKLYWIDGNIANLSNINDVRSRGVIVTTENDIVRISGLEKEEVVNYYSIDGVALGKQIAFNGCVQFYTSTPIVIVRIGNSSLKVMTRP